MLVTVRQMTQIKITVDLNQNLYLKQHRCEDLRSHMFKLHYKTKINLTSTVKSLNPLNTELNPICHLLALLGAHHFLHVSMIRVNLCDLHNVVFVLAVTVICVWFYNFLFLWQQVGMCRMYVTHNETTT
jgi:hypothetical protein